jgi:hypothetical protein
MADSYSVLYSYTTEELRGGSQLANVRVIGFQTTPSGVIAETRLDLSLIDATQIQPIVKVLADGIEIVAQNDHVAGVSYLQDVNQAGQLDDFLDITVQSNSGNSTEDMEIRLGDVYALGANAGVPDYNLPGRKAQSIGDVVQRLDAIEGL